MGEQSSKKESRSKQRRNRSVLESLPLTQAEVMWFADVESHGLGSAVARQCPKCQGLLMAQAVDLTTKDDIRCINCGWQPQWGTRVVTESDELRSIRRLTAELCSTGLVS